MLVSRGRIHIICDVANLREPDAATVDGLARMQLLAQRIGASLELRNARRELVDLLRLVGLAALLGVEVGRQAEQLEVCAVHEEVDPGDAAL